MDRWLCISEERPLAIDPQAYRGHQASDLWVRPSALRGSVEDPEDRRLLPSRMFVLLFYQDSPTKHTELYNHQPRAQTYKPSSIASQPTAQCLLHAALL